jgi:hypothetical protein
MAESKERAASITRLSTRYHSFFLNASRCAAKKTKQNIHSPGCREYILLVIEQEGIESKGKS